LHKFPQEILLDFCKKFGITFQQSLLKSTYHGKQWWGDRVSGQFLKNFNSNIDQKKWVGFLSWTDRFQMDCLIGNRMHKYGYQCDSVGSLSFFMIPILILPTGYEMRILLARPFRLKFIAESFWFYLRRLKFQLVWFFKKTLTSRVKIPEMFLEK
jgi:hypothetical protein